MFVQLQHPWEPPSVFRKNYNFGLLIDAEDLRVQWQFRKLRFKRGACGARNLVVSLEQRPREVALRYAPR